MKIELSNEESGTVFTLDEKCGFDIDADEDPCGINIEGTTDDGEFTVLFPADAWVVILDGRLAVKYSQYNGNKQQVSFLGYDKS